MHSHGPHPTTPPSQGPPGQRFRVILADPPWQAQQTGRHGAGQHYPLMTPQRILGMGPAIQALAAEQAFCFLWVTTATVPLGIKVLEAWGFAYTSFYFWAKPRLLMGNTFRNAGELLLLGLRGRGTRVSFRAQPNWGFYPLQDHSHKPEEIHSMIERLVATETIRTIPQASLAVQTEPACWRRFLGPHGQPLTLRPDLHLAITTPAYHDRYFIEVDRATENPARVIAACQRYVHYRQLGIEQQATGLFPAVLWIVPHQARRTQLARHLAEAQLPDGLFHSLTLAELPALLRDGPPASHPDPDQEPPAHAQAPR